MKSSWPSQVIWLVFGIHALLAATVAIAVPGPDRGPLAIGTAFGVLTSQVSLCAVWAALGDQRFVLRLAGSLLCVAAVGAAVTCYLVRAEGTVGMGLAASAAMLIAWGFLQMPFWTLRMWQGWYIGRRGIGEVAAVHRIQFGIRELLLWTAAIAFLSAFGRALFQVASTWEGSRWEATGWLIFFVLAALFHVLLTIPAICAPLVHRWMPLWFLGSFVIGVGVTVAEIATLQGLPVGPEGESSSEYAVFNATVLLSIQSTMLALRGCGYQLLRRKPV